MSWGSAEGWRWEDLAATYGEPSGPEDTFGPDGESWASFVKRGSRALSMVVREHAGSSIVAVTHTGIVEVSFILFAHLPKRINRFEMKPLNAGLSSWVSVQGSSPPKWRLEQYNDVSHLWRSGRLLHGPDDYSDLRQGGDPFWDAVGRDGVISSGIDFPAFNSGA
jgi:broad specificity phosphatase PhoE